MNMTSVKSAFSDQLPKLSLGSCALQFDDDKSIEIGGILSGSILLELTEEFKSKCIQISVYGCEESTFSLMKTQS